MSDLIFCPECEQLLLADPVCPACRWERPQPAPAPGDFDPEPLPLGSVLTGAPAVFDDAVWYAALPASREEAGALISLHRGGTIVRRHELASFLPPPARPVTEAVTADKHLLFVGLRDYAFGEERAPKPLLALEPRSGQTAWRLPTPSRELSPPLVHDGSVYAAGTSPGAVYALDPRLRQLRWQATVDVDARFRPAAAHAAVVVLAGPLVGERTLTALAPEDGRVRWQVPAPAGAGQPLGSRDLLLVPGKDALHAYDAAGGDERWRYRPERATSRGVATASPVIAGNRLLLPTGAPGGYALDALDLESGDRCWHVRLPVRRRIKVAPVLLGNIVLVGNSAGDLYGLDLESGDFLWQKQFPGGLAAVPVALAQSLLLPGRDGLLYRLAWQRTAPRPAHSPSELEAQGAWKEAAVAHALADPPDLVRAGRCLLRAREPERALALFEHAADDAGIADALAALDRHQEAAPLLGEQERWAEAGAAYEAAGAYQQALDAYRQAQQQEQVERLMALLGSHGADRLVESVGWEAALDHFRRAGDDETAATVVEDYAQPELAAARAARDWERVHALCQKLEDWRGEAEACRELAAAVPRREVRVEAAPAWTEPTGLPPELHQRLSAAFRASDAFESDRRLRALFADERLAVWRPRLREADSIDARVESAVELLHDQYNRAGENGLLLLTRVLAERLHPDDGWRARLEALSDDVATAAHPETRARTELRPLPEAYRWWARAGEVFAAHGAWAEAESDFRRARHHVRWAEALARQERWEEAGDLLREERVAFEQAAGYYWQAALAAQADRPAWQKRAMRAAAFFQKAQECFLFCGNLEGLLLCRTEADRSLARPRLLLGDGSLARPLQQGLVSRFTLPLYNVGFGPATDVRVWAFGNALQRQRQDAQPVGPPLPVLVAGEETTVALTVEPQASAHESIPLEIDLVIRYRDVEEVEREEGPYAIHQPVLPATASPTVADPAPIRPHHEGTYYDTAEQVRIIRAVRDGEPERAPVTTVLARLREQLAEA